jgi:hypothetical protein
VLATQFLRQHQRHGSAPVPLTVASNTLGSRKHSYGALSSKNGLSSCAAAEQTAGNSHRGTFEAHHEPQKRRRGPKPLQRLCETLESPKRCGGGLTAHVGGSAWMCAAAYLAWALVPQLDAADAAHVCRAVCQGCRELVQDNSQESAGWACALAWGLFALEGFARCAWGVPRHLRCCPSLRSLHLLVSIENT